MYKLFLSTAFLLAPFISSLSQSGTIRRITLGEAISAAILNNPNLNSGCQKKALIAEVENIYMNQVYQINRCTILQKQAGMMRDIERVANLRFEAGDIDLLEKTAMIDRIAVVRTEISMLDDDITISGNKLKLLLLTSEDFLPADSVITLYAIQKGTDPPDTGLLADFKRENLVSELNKYFKKILYFQQVALPRADILIKINRLRFEKEDIDYFEFVQNADDAFHIQLEYLQTINNYNQTAIQLELYAY